MKHPCNANCTNTDEQTMGAPSALSKSSKGNSITIYILTFKITTDRANYFKAIV